MAWERSQRLEALPPYLFVEIDRAKREAIAAGRDVINFGVGDPDRPTFEFIVEAMRRAVADPANHRYPFDEGVPAFRAAAARFMMERYGVELDPAAEIITCIGAKEAIAHLPLAVVNPGEVVLVPRPGYPVYYSAAVFAGAEPVIVPLNADNGWLPELEAIDERTARRAKLIYVNYPNNPTGAVAGLDFFARAVDFCRRHDILLCSDAAYSEVVLSGEPAPGVLQVPGAEDTAIEFHSLSKTFNMTGWRVGFAAGNAGAVAALLGFKTNVDSGVFGVVQQAAEAAWRAWPEIVEPTLAEYRRRARLLAEGLRRLGLEVQPPRATFYLWLEVPGGDDVAFTERLLEQTGVLVTPGSGFGPSGRGFVRLCLTQPLERIDQALDRLAGFSPDG